MKVGRFGWIAVTAGVVALSGPIKALEPAILLLPTPPFAAHTAPGVKTRAKTRLVKVSERRNQVTDEDAWLARNGLALPVLDGGLPVGAPENIEGAGLYRAVGGTPNIQLLMGQDGSGAQYVVGFDPKAGEPRYTLDFRRYFVAPTGRVEEGTEQKAQWATERNGVLYVSNYHRTYAKSSGGKNGYLTALDPKTGRMKWRSRSLVSNTRNFLVLGDAIITGYGFTAEPDFLYVLDRGNGTVVQTVPVKSGPEWIIQKGNRLHIRTYDTDYVFRVRS